RFHPFVDLLRSLLGLGEATSGDRFSRLEGTVSPVLGAETEELLPLVALLLDVPLPDAAAQRMAAVRADVIDRLLLQALLELLLGFARARPLGLFFEDLYWADRSSIELLGELMRVALDAPVLFLFTARPGFPETTGRVSSVARTTLPAERVVLIELRPLD